MIWFNFWEQVYYRNWTDKTGKVLMNPRKFVGFVWNVGEPMTFKMLQCIEDMHKQIIVLHIGVVGPVFSNSNRV